MKIITVSSKDIAKHPNLSFAPKDYTTHESVEDIVESKQYLLHWRNNPATWNDNLKDLIKKGKVQKIKNRWYTTVSTEIFGKDMFVIDCICDLETGDSYPIYTDLLKKLPK